MEHSYKNSMPTTQVAAWLVRKYPEKFAKVWKYAPMMIPMRTIMPTVTPVDYAQHAHGPDIPEDTDIFHFWGGIIR